MTLSELLDQMRSFANVDENRLPDSEATAFLNEAKDEIMTANRFRFGEVFVQSAFSADTQTFSPSPSSGRFIAVTRVWYASTSTGERVEVNPLTWNEYVERWGTADTSTDGSGSPVDFAVYGETDAGDPVMYLGPIPDEAVNPVFVTGRIVCDDLEDDDDETAVSARMPLALVYYALYLASDFLEDPDRGQAWLEKAQKIIKREALSHEAARRSARMVTSMTEPS